MLLACTELGSIFLSWSASPRYPSQIHTSTPTVGPKHAPFQFLFAFFHCFTPALTPHSKINMQVPILSLPRSAIYDHLEGTIVCAEYFAIQSQSIINTSSSAVFSVHTSASTPFLINKPSNLSNPKLMSPFPALPLPTRMAHLQRVTNSLISADSLSFSDVMRSCMRNDDAIAKFARDPELY
ncbi:hypothetical protein OCU04_001407 [Sclerotinia nivalis]|uniref:Uncharacterized protein n=1 Tax=Sclerotinia nivalis TaxID=352851 RepID=A0A9X0AY37_9HELO|nr:hypothetical protein OCU04_001407 [Sclerotinia nivalis]